MTTITDDIKPVNKKKIIKKIARLVVRTSVSGTMVTLVHQNVQTASKIQKIQLYVGAYYVGQVVADAAWKKGSKDFEQISKLIDNVVVTWKSDRETSQTDTPQ